MFKRTIALILSVIMTINFGIIAFAEDTEDVSKGTYLLSEEVPVAAINHVQSSLRKLLGDILAVSEVTVSEPFKVFRAQNNLYYFVVYADGKMVGTYRVFETEDGYSGVFSEDTQILNGLMQLSNFTTANNPAKIVSGDHHDMYAIVNNDIYTIVEDPFGDSTDFQTLLTQPASYAANSVVDISNTIEVDFSNQSVRTTPAQAYIQLDLLETQTTLPWCTAYSTASILRYKTGHALAAINVNILMRFAYPGKSDSELATLTFSVDNAIAYAHRYGIYPTYVLHRRAYSAIASDIFAGNPVMFVFDNLSTGKSLTHVMVCRGYYDNHGDSYYSVWNPWNTYYERIYTSDNIYYISSSGEARYKWAATAYGWGIQNAQ